MVFKRFYDIADYPVGYFFNIGVFKVLKYKMGKIMEKDEYLIVISIFGREYILS